MTRPSLTLALASAGLAIPALAQENITYSWNVVEVTAGTDTPVANPNGAIELGEAARLELTVTITPGIGSVVTFVPPPAPGSGTLAGLASIFFDLTASASAGAGTWSFLGRHPAFALSSVGTVSGNNITSAQAGQFVIPGQTANPTNPIHTIWHGVWNPNGDYQVRTVRFTSAGAVQAGTFHSAVLVQYGLDPNGHPAYVPKYTTATFGIVELSFIPAPSVLALLGLGSLVAARRRRAAPPT